jgi:hypothetical protein
MKITKKDVGRPVIFQGFDHGIYEGYIDKVHTTEFDFTFAHIVYRVPRCSEPISVPLSVKHWDRIAFRVTE